MTRSSSPIDESQFIPGIYNYCDEWCSACQLAARCRVKAEIDAEAPSEHSESLAMQVQGWFRRASGIVDDTCRRLGVDAGAIQSRSNPKDRPPITIDHARLVSRGRAYGDAVFGWQKQRPVDPDRRTELDPGFPQDVIDHFTIIIGAKIQRAVLGFTFETARSRGEDPQSDANGSAKAAILAAERSRTAWSDLLDSGLVSNDIVHGFERSLTWLIDELDRLFPNARKFVRPGFDDA